MRNLTVIRRKTFVACLGSVKIYIEDANGNTNINGTKCRLLGKLKNNSRETFEIGNESCKVFAIYDKASKGICNDVYIIPEGEDDLYISGIAHFNPFIGNPFYFDGTPCEEAIAMRKQTKKKAVLIMVPVMIIAVIAGFMIGWYLA